MHSMVKCLFVATFLLILFNLKFFDNSDSLSYNADIPFPKGEAYMRRFLNVGMIQSETYPLDFETCLARIRKDVDDLMAGMHVPELVLGVEMAIGRYWADDETQLGGDTIPGRVTDELGRIAKEYGIYFIPGSMIESCVENGEKKLYNSLPIFGPDGEIIDVYRKICPYYPAEEGFSPGNKYVTFDIKEKNIKIGVMICHDWCFPEISRNLTLMGAEFLFRPAIDPEGLYESCKALAPARAFENQAYFLSLNASGDYLGGRAYGRSILAGPDGNVLWEAGDNTTMLTVTLDFDRVSDVRRYGTNYTDQLLRQLKVFDPPMPYAGSLADAPVFRDLPEPDMTMAERAEMFKKEGLMNIGRK